MIATTTRYMGLWLSITAPITLLGVAAWWRERRRPMTLRHMGLPPHVDHDPRSSAWRLVSAPPYDQDAEQL